MVSKEHLSMRKSVFLLIGQLCVLLACLAYVFFTYSFNINPDKQVKQSFLHTDCFLLSKKLSSKGHILRQYRADFRVSYTVNNVQYTRWVSGNGLDNSFMHDATEQEEVLSQFDDGGSYPCWYNPTDPEEVVLVMRKNWTSTFPLMLPAVIFILAFYFFVKNILRMIFTRSKSIKKKK